MQSFAGTTRRRRRLYVQDGRVRRSAVAGLPVHERLVLPNVATEVGAKAGIVEPDGRTVDFLEAQTGRHVDVPDHARADDDADDGAVYTCRADDLAPQVATPSNPESAVDVDEVTGTTVADIVQGERLASSVRMVVVPASRAVYRRMLETGVTETLADAGAIVQSAGCGPCFGTHRDDV